jgi:hypothetical protein
MRGHGGGRQEVAVPHPRWHDRKSNAEVFDSGNAPMGPFLCARVGVARRRDAWTPRQLGRGRLPHARQPVLRPLGRCVPGVHSERRPLPHASQPYRPVPAGHDVHVAGVARPGPETMAAPCGELGAARRDGSLVVRPTIAAGIQPRLAARRWRGVRARGVVPPPSRHRGGIRLDQRSLGLARGVLARDADVAIGYGLDAYPDDPLFRAHGMRWRYAKGNVLGAVALGRAFDVDDPLCPEVRRQLLIWASKTEPGEQRIQLQESATALACAGAP